MSTPTLRQRTWAPLAVVAVAGLALAVLFAGPLGVLRDALLGPSGPSAGDSTLLEIRETAELRAATGSYSVPIYFGYDESGIRRVIPGFLDKDTSVAIYQGSIDALIDLNGLTEDDIVIDETDNSVTITVPAPVLTSPNVDEAKSRVIAQQRGLGTRVSDFFAGAPLEQREEMDAEAVAALQQAAVESGLLDTARENGRDFLTTLAERLGHDDVTVVFADEGNSQ